MIFLKKIQWLCFAIVKIIFMENYFIKINDYRKAFIFFLLLFLISGRITIKWNKGRKCNIYLKLGSKFMKLKKNYTLGWQV